MTLTALKPRTTPETAPTPDGLATPKSVRERLELKRAEMAALFGMSEYGYGQWEDGNRRPGGPAYRLLFVLDGAGPETAARLRAFPG
ncbi:MAG: hypothetical protein AAGP08_09725 [Pseudomonadota bacterium]